MLVTIPASHALRYCPHRSVGVSIIERRPVVRKKRVCAKCGIVKKSGKLSCCARGGAWFKKCGDFGDTLFDHTWHEGIQACKGAAASMNILRHTGVDVYPLDTVQSGNTQQQTNVGHAGSMSSKGTRYFEGCTRPVKIVVYISVLFIILHLQT